MFLQSCLVRVALVGVLLVHAQQHDYPSFYAQQADGHGIDHSGQWHWHTETSSHPASVHVFDEEEGMNHGDSCCRSFSHFPGHGSPRKAANGTIFEVLSEASEFSRLFKVVNTSDEIVSLLNDSSRSLTFFALPNHAIPERHPRRRHPRDIKLNLNSLLNLSLDELIVYLESAGAENGAFYGRPSDEDITKIVTAILSYHIIPDKLDLVSLTNKNTHPTNLSHVFGALKNEALRLRVGAGLPFTTINFYSHIVKPNIGATNGVIHVVNRPLLPPPPVFQTVFLLQNKFATFSSALQHAGLTNELEYKFVHESSPRAARLVGSPVVTAFAPSNNAFAKLPRKLQFFLFSPFGERALKKLLQYHIVPEIVVHTDWVLNVTSNEVAAHFCTNLVASHDKWLASSIAEAERQFGSEFGEAHLTRSLHRAHCAERSPYLDLLSEPRIECRSGSGFVRSSPCAGGILVGGHEHRQCHPFAGYGYGSRSCKQMPVEHLDLSEAQYAPAYGGDSPSWTPKGSGERIKNFVYGARSFSPCGKGCCRPEHLSPDAHPLYNRLNHPEVVANYTLSTALEGHPLNVLVVRIPIRLPVPKHGKEIGHITKVLVNGQPVSIFDGVALNGALHVVDKLISPRRARGKPHGPTHANVYHSIHDLEEEGDDWEDWEDWLPDWVDE